MNVKKWRPELIALVVAAAATRFWNLFSPNAVVFDEVYFKSFTGQYFTGHYYFDIHPPLGKLLLAGFAKLIGQTGPGLINGTAVDVRILPALAGALLVPVMWGILRRLGASRAFAFLGSGLILFDNALLVESRFILMDSMLLLAGMSAVYFYLIARNATNRRRFVWLALATFSAGVALSIKWTGLNAIAIIALLWLWDQRSRIVSYRRRIAEAALFIIIPAVIYLCAFWVHFQLLPKSGTGDAFMSTQFQSTLIGNSYYNPKSHLSFWNKFIQLNVEMYHANATLTATHPYGSRWYSWPLEIRPIYYWEGDALSNGEQGNIYLLGNPIIWWGIWIAIISGLCYLWLTRRRLRPATIGILAMTAIAYAINILPFVGVTRVLFLYHYFFAFAFSIIFAIMLWNDIATTKSGHQLQSTNQRVTLGVVMALVVLGFIYFAPLSYGIPLSPAGLQARMWLHSWR